MRRTGTLRLALVGLLLGGLMASGAAATDAHQAKPRKKPQLTARIGPPTVPVGEPATLTARLKPAKKGVRLLVQRRIDGAWRDDVRITTRAGGRAALRLDTSTVGTQQLRVLRTARKRSVRATSRPVSLTVVADPSCTPRIAPVDAQADEAARCLAARLDRWQAANAMAVGQQLNVSSSGYRWPLDQLGVPALPVVGFDLEELSQGQGYGFSPTPLDALVALAQQGVVLSASWHARNPATGGGYDDTSDRALDAVLQPGPTADRFWADFDARMALLRQLQDAGVAVVLRPLHEANGAWFWWGDPAPATYRAVWAAMQQRAAALGVHNVLWAYSFNAVTGDHIGDPVPLVPAQVDLAGLDSYDPEQGDRTADRLDTTGYAEVAALVARMAFTEIGPYDSPDGAWDPAVVAQAARELASPPIWSMLWFDDGGGRKQLGSLQGGPAWLQSCAGGFCNVAR